MMEMLWTDPQIQPGRGPSKRGVGLQFGPDVTKRFCENNGLEAIIRSHEVRMEGYEEEHDGKCITGESIKTGGWSEVYEKTVTDTSKHSILGAEILRHYGKQRRIHQYWSGLEIAIPQVRCCTASGHQADGEPMLSYLICPKADSTAPLSLEQMVSTC